jgi:hypothetical protein
MLELLMGVLLGGTTTLFSLGLCEAAKKADNAPTRR